MPSTALPTPQKRSQRYSIESRGRTTRWRACVQERFDGVSKLVGRRQRRVKWVERISERALPNKLESCAVRPVKHV